MGNYRRILIAIFLLLSSSALKAQWQSQQQLSAKMQLYSITNPSTTLFVHFDKTIYTNNETVWFTGYLLKANETELAKHTILSVALIRDRDSTIVKHDKYLISNGFSFGSMILPDSMLTGNYHFQVTTNRVSKGKPDVSFIQPILIKTNIDPAFKASIRLLEPGILNKKPNQVVVSVLTRDARFLPKPAEVSYRYGSTIKKAMTNTSGELQLSLPEQPAQADPNVYASIRYGKDICFVNMPLPISQKKAKVRFYPEGGNLIAGISSKIAWEVKDHLGSLVTLKAQLFKDNVPIQTIETNAYGVGQFKLIPADKSIYTVKLIHSGFADSIYRLPVVIEKGISVLVKEGAAKDTLELRLLSKQPQKVALRLHDFINTFFYKEYSLSTSDKALKIPLTGISKGLKAITIFDTLGRPLSERMVFTHYDPSKKAQIATDKEVYGQREKVTLKLKMTGTDTLGFVSIACVQDNRLQAMLSNDIESYTYLKQELGILPIAPNGRGFESKDYVEDMLLTKGWRRYTWTDIFKTQTTDTLKAYDSLAVQLIIKNKNKIDQPVNVGLMREGKTGIDSTDSTGILTFKNQQLLIADGKKISVFVAEKNPKDYAISIHDSYFNLNKSYIRSLQADYSEIPSTVQNNDEFLLKTNERVIKLKEVNITSGKDYGIHYNECGEYVCKFGFLNCPPHAKDSGNTPPIIGTTYKVFTGFINGQDTFYYSVYRGCKDASLFTQIPGIYTKKDFYTADYNDPTEPAFVSTLYWNHGVLLNSKDQELTFYTGDITGKFRIVVQGITNNDLIYAQHFFEVKAKPLNSAP